MVLHHFFAFGRFSPIYRALCWYSRKSSQIQRQAVRPTKIPYLTSRRYVSTTAYMGQLNLPPIIWNVSHLKIFPLELLGPAIGFSAGPSSCKGKILRWDTTTNSLTTNKCLILDVVGCNTNIVIFNFASYMNKFCSLKLVYI